MRLSVCVECLDRHALDLLAALRSMGARLTLALPGREAPSHGPLAPAEAFRGGALGGCALADEAAGLFEEALPPQELDHAAPLLCIPAPSLLPHEAPCFRPEAWEEMAAHARGPLFLEASRLPLSGRGEAVARRWAALFPEPLALIHREERQRERLAALRPRVCLHLPDFLRASRVGRAHAADVAWLLANAARLAAGEPPEPALPPSRLAPALLNAPAGDPEARRMAQAVRRIDPLFLPALLRLLALDGADRTGSHAALLEQAAKADPQSWLHQLAAQRHPSAPAGPQAHLRPDPARLFPSLAPERRGRKRILLIVVYKARDLFLDLMLRRHLEDLGHEVFMRPLNLSTCNSLLDLCPDLVIWGARTTPIQRNLSRFAADRGIMQAVRREEGLIYAPSWTDRPLERKALTLGSEDYSPWVDLELGYNATFRRVVCTEGHMPPERVFSVGAMPFDPYFLRELGAALPGRETLFARLSLDPAKRLLVMATPWSYADRDPAKAIPEADRKDPVQVREAQDAVRAAQAGRAAWLDFLKRFCAEHGREWNVLLKIHPGERVEAYDAFIADNGLPAATLCGGYMVEVLRHCDLLMHAGSTTAVEAHLLGVPSFAYWVFPTFRHPLYEVSHIVNSYEEFQEFLGRTPLGRSNMREGCLEYLQDGFYGAMDGQSCRRAALAVDALLAQSRRLPHRLPGDSWVPHEAFPPVPDELGLHIGLDEAEGYAAGIRAAMAGRARRRPPGTAGRAAARKS